MKKIIIAILVQVIVLFAGNYGDAFINASRPASVVGLGNMGVTQVTGIQSVLTNPAGLTQTNRNEMFIQYNNLFGMGYQHGLGIMTKHNEKYYFGITWNRVAIDELTERIDLFDYDLEERREYVREHFGKGETFSNSENVIHFSIARNFLHTINAGWNYDKFNIENPVGINIKLLSKSMYNEHATAKGAGIDIGTKFIIPGEDVFSIPRFGNVIIGFNLANVYQTPIIWSNDHVDMAKMKLYSGISLQQPIKFFSSVVWIMLENEKTKDESNFRYGFQWEFKDLLNVRFGRDLLNSNIGFGLKLPYKDYDLKIDYSLENHPIEMVHRISLTLFGRGKNVIK